MGGFPDGGFADVDHSAMIRELRLVLYFLVGLFLGGVSVLSRADTVPSSIVDLGPPIVSYNVTQWGRAWYPSRTAACASLNPIYGDAWNSYAEDNGVCRHYNNGPVDYYTYDTNSACSDGSGADAQGKCMAVQCPTVTFGSSYALSSDKKSCTRTDPCTAGTAVSSGYYDMGTSPGGFSSVACGANGCMLSFTGNSPAATSLVSGVTHYYAQGAFAQVGGDTSACTGGASPSATGAPPPPSCGANQSGGTVNGKFTCLDKSTGVPAATTPPSTVTENRTITINNDNSATVTITTVNNDGSRSVSVVNYSPGTPSTSGGPPAPGGPGVPGSTPTQKIITTTPVPTGQATPLPATPTTPDPAKDPCIDNPGRVGCQELGAVDDPGALVSQSVGLSALSPVSMPGSSACPADIPLPKGNHFSWRPICDGMEMFRPLVLAVAWLTAGLIVVGAKNG